MRCMDHYYSPNPRNKKINQIHLTSKLKELKRNKTNSILVQRTMKDLISTRLYYRGRQVGKGAGSSPTTCTENDWLPLWMNEAGL